MNRIIEQHIRRHPPLTLEEERRLLRLAAEGDIEARNKIVEAHLALVLKVVGRWTRDDAEREELFPVACAALIKAVERYDLKKAPEGKRFYHWAGFAIRHALRSEAHGRRHRLRDAQITDPEVIEQTIGAEEPGFADYDPYAETLAREIVDDAIELLGWEDTNSPGAGGPTYAPLRAAAARLVLLGGWQKIRAAEIIGSSRENVRQAVERVLAVVRRDPRVHREAEERAA